MRILHLLLRLDGDLIFDAKGNKQLAMYIEKAMQVHVLNRQVFSRENIKQIPADCGFWLSATRGTLQSRGLLLPL